MSHPTLQLHQFSVADWQKMGAMDLFTPGARIELIDGQITDMPPIGSEHSGCAGWLNNYLIQQVQQKAIVFMQNPLRLGGFSEPLPDIMLLKPRADFYRKSHPLAEDVLLLIEIADSSVNYDKNVKIPLYARYGIIETWLVNIPQQIIHVYQHIESQQYKVQLNKKVGEMLTPECLSTVQLSVAQILGLD